MAFPEVEFDIGIALLSALIFAFLPEVQPLAVLNLG